MMDENLSYDRIQETFETFRSRTAAEQMAHHIMSELAETAHKGGHYVTVDGPWMDADTELVEEYAEEVISELADEYGVPRNRIKVSHRNNGKYIMKFRRVFEVSL